MLCEALKRNTKYTLSVSDCCTSNLLRNFAIERAFLNLKLFAVIYIEQVLASVVKVLELRGLALLQVPHLLPHVLIVRVSIDRVYPRLGHTIIYVVLSSPSSSLLGRGAFGSPVFILSGRRGRIWLKYFHRGGLLFFFGDLIQSGRNCLFSFI